MATKSFAEHQFKKRELADTEIRVWQERDRLHIHLVDKRTEKTLAEWWDDDAREAIEDGFLDAREGVFGNLQRFARQLGPLHESAFKMITRGEGLVRILNAALKR